MLDHIGSIRDGHLVEFPHSARTFMKVCTCDGIGGVVDIVTGELIMVRDLSNHGLDVWCSERLEEEDVGCHEFEPGKYHVSMFELNP